MFAVAHVTFGSNGVVRSQPKNSPEHSPEHSKALLKPSTTAATSRNKPFRALKIDATFFLALRDIVRSAHVG